MPRVLFGPHLKLVSQFPVARGQFVGLCCVWQSHMGHHEKPELIHQASTTGATSGRDTQTGVLAWVGAARERTAPASAPAASERSSCRGRGGQGVLDALLQQVCQQRGTAGPVGRSLPTRLDAHDRGEPGGRSHQHCRQVQGSGGNLQFQPDTLDVQMGTTTSALLAVVTGKLKIDNGNQLHYLQMFQLVSTGPGAYYVHNDILRLIYS